MTPGIEPGIRVLQTHALPLGHVTTGYIRSLKDRNRFYQINDVIDKDLVKIKFKLYNLANRAVV